MATLKFADTHNMVAFLSKFAKSDGFEQIVDFLNTHPIKYALTVNPTIYTSCIEQFWSTVKVKTINGESQLHARVDGKKLIITESTIRRDLQLVDEEGVDCLLNSVIFEQLALMGSKTIAWNEFSSTMASAIICLATNQKFNFSKFIFESMVKNLDNLSRKFLMYPRFVQVFLEQQLDDLSTHESIYIALSHTKKIFANMRRVPQRSGPSDNVADEDVHSLVRAATTASSLEVEQDSGNINKTQSKETPYESSSHGISSGGGPSLRRRVKKLEQKKRSRTHGLKRLRKVGATSRVESSGNEEILGDDASKQGRIDVIDEDEAITLVSVQNEDEEMLVAEQEVATNKEDDGVNIVEEVVEVINTAKLIFDAAQVSVASDKVSTASVATTVSAATTTTADDLTLAQALQELKSIKPKVKGVVIQEPAEFDEEERLTKEKAEKEKEANVALIETWDDIHAKIDADYQLAERLQAEEQEELSVEEKAKLFQQLLEQRRKNFAAKSAEEKRNKLPTQVQQRKIMCTYLKNMKGKKLKDLKNKSFDSIQKMFDKAFKRVDTFIDFRTDLVEGSSKRVREELEQESTKKQKVDEDKYTAELQSLMEVIPDEEEVAIDVVPLATNPPTIVDWKIHKEGKNSYFQIIRVDGSSKMYLVFSQLLKSVDREDLVELYKLVKAKYGSTRPVEDMDLLL
ncbi:hypothetical protein Tco_0981956 [Tanacetum coccineum]